MGMIGNSLAQGLISGANIQDGTVDTPDIKDGAIHTAKIADGAVTSAKLAADITVTGSFTSQGIDDNASVTAMTLDASGNLLVGKTSANSDIAGFEANASGFTAATRDNGTVFVMDRLTSDGGILSFRKDNSTVGNISSASGVTLDIDGGGSYTGIRFDSASWTPRDGGTVIDNTVDLGKPTARFKDLYLSGGVYLGGTGSANKLDDIEEGTYVPDLILSGYGTIAGDTNYSGHYIKIKDSVWFNVYCRWNISSRTGVTETKISLPFTSARTSQNYSAIYVSYISNMLQSTGTNLLGGYVIDDSSTLRLHLFRDTTEVTIGDAYLTTSTSAGIMVSGYYRAA